MNELDKYVHELFMLGRRRAPEFNYIFAKNFEELMESEFEKVIGIMLTHKDYIQKSISVVASSAAQIVLRVQDVFKDRHYNRACEISDIHFNTFKNEFRDDVTALFTRKLLDEEEKLRMERQDAYSEDQERPATPFSDMMEEASGMSNKDFGDY